MEQTELYPLDPLDPLDPRNDRMLIKHVNALAIMPTKGGGKITVLESKLYNVLLHRAQSEGVRDEYFARMHELVKDAGFDSNRTDIVKKALKNLRRIGVEWQSPTNGEVERWEECGLLSGVSIEKDKRTNAVVVGWRYDVKIREQLLNPARYAGLDPASIRQLRTYPALALYGICARYVDNPGRKTARQHWRWWRPVLCGQAYDPEKGEYRYFKRDVLQPAIAEINANTELEVSLLPEFKERDNKTISDIQFEVRLKRSKALPSAETKPLDKVEPVDLKLIGAALKLGVTQDEAEGLYREYGAEALKKGLNDLEKRLAVPEQVAGPVEKPGSYLRSIMRPKAGAPDSVAKTDTGSRGRTGKDMERNKAALTEEWLRRKKDELRSLFQEHPEAEQTELLAQFREYSQIQPLLKRFDTSGWNHRQIRDIFAAFLGETWHGSEWNKPTPDELLTLALEKAQTAA